MDETREKIIQAARIVFAHKGFRATIKDIAKAANISSPSLIFWYFKDKQQLLMKVASAASPFSHIHDLVQTTNTSSPSEKLRIIGFAYLKAYSDPLERQILLQLMGNATAVPEIRDLLHDQVASVTSRYIASLIEAGQQNGEFCLNINAEFLAQTFVGALYALVTRWEVEGHLPWTNDAIVQQLLNLVQCS